MTKICILCGGTIDDTDIYPRTKKCRACRIHRQDSTIMTYNKYGNDVKQFFDAIGWPKFLRVGACVEDNEDLLSDFKTTNRGRINIISLCLPHVNNDNGEKYVHYSGSTRKIVYVLEKTN